MGLASSAALTKRSLMTSFSSRLNPAVTRKASCRGRVSATPMVSYTSRCCIVTCLIVRGAAGFLISFSSSPPACSAMLGVESRERALVRGN